MNHSGVKQCWQEYQAKLREVERLQALGRALRAEAHRYETLALCIEQEAYEEYELIEACERTAQ